MAWGQLTETAVDHKGSDMWRARVTVDICISNAIS
jgi:hypothetical protein